MPNPYSDLSPDHFWKPAVAAVEPHSVMPIRSNQLAIGTGSLVATAGSCFAQEIGKYLQSMPGITLLRAEAMEPEYPLFSALYGNIYTARQLVQLFDRAFDHFVPVDSAWRRKDGRHVDPFRPYVFREGFETVTQVEAARGKHLAAVRHVFTDSSVFIFTLGLTETWCAKADGAIFPIAPGVVIDEINLSKYQFKNLGYDEVLDDLRDFFSRLRSVNRTVRVILTVSPVPLTATYTSEHILVATTQSKAVLRAVCGAADAEYDFVHYFPSYEIITGNFTRGRYYDANLRTVTRQGIEHVMALFRQTYFDTKRQRLAEVPDMAALLASVEETPVCDEEEIVRSVGF